MKPEHAQKEILLIEPIDEFRVRATVCREPYQWGDKIGYKKRTKLHTTGRHSPDGFAVGYEGSGPAELALAICLFFGVTDRGVYQEFKRKVIARLTKQKRVAIPLSYIKMTIAEIRKGR